ncbi:hypothetical protein ACFL6U_16770 [Planctomycetota bacterium]
MSDVSSRVAVDVVLLPDSACQEVILKLNAELVEREQSAIRLDIDRCLPHLSLAMGCVERHDLVTLKTLLIDIVDTHIWSPLQIAGVTVRQSGGFKRVSSLVFSANPSLQTLHESVLKIGKPLFCFAPTPPMFAGDDPISESTLAWVRTYVNQSSRDRFWPHITLGYGAVSNRSPMLTTMSPKAVAVCHLGNHCTCRQVLFELPVA